MKSVSGTLQTHLGQVVTTLAVLWKVTLQSGTVLSFTSFDLPITYLSVTYTPTNGVLPSANNTNSDMSVDTLTLTGFLDGTVVKDVDIRNGLYDYARVEQRIVNWSDLTQGDLLLRKGILGNVKMVNGLFDAEVRGLTQYLSTLIGSLFGPMCRAELFSDQSNTIDPGSKYLCHVKQSDYQQNGSVSTALDANHITAAGLKMVGSATPTAAAPAGWFNDGVIVFTSGLNNGFSFEIESWDGTTLFFLLPLTNQPAPGDTFNIVPGCDKSPTSTGCLKFQGYSSDSLQTIVASTNILNFRGEPQIPGMDGILDYPVPKP